MKNKRAFLLGKHTLGLLIAVLCILILVYAGVKVYGMLSTKEKKESAEDNLNLIVNKVEYLKSPDYTKDFLYVTITPPERWFLRSYMDWTHPKGECLDKQSCLCMCDNINCDGLKTCRGFDFLVYVGHYEQNINNVFQLKSLEELKIEKRKTEEGKDAISIERRK